MMNVLKFIDAVIDMRIAQKAGLDSASKAESVVDKACEEYQQTGFVGDKYLQK